MVTMKYQRLQNLWSRRLIQRAGNTGERVVGVAPDQTHGADHQYQDDGEHDGIFSDILSLFVRANILEKLNHISSPTRNKFPRQTCVANNDDSDGVCQ